MYEEKSSTFLRECTHLVNRDSHNQGQQCHQNTDKPIDHHSTEPPGDPSSDHMHTQHHQICHPSQQTTCKCTNGHNGKDTSGVTALYNITHSLYSSLSYQQIVLHTLSILANLWDSLYYIREIALHTMDYIDATTTGILSPHVLPVEDLREMLKHIEETLPSTTHLPISL